MRNSWGGLVESRLLSSTRPGFVRQASGVLVGVGKGEGIRVGGRVGGAVVEGGMAVGAGCSEGEQAKDAPRRRSSAPIRFIA